MMKLSILSILSVFLVGQAVALPHPLKSCNPKHGVQERGEEQVNGCQIAEGWKREEAKVDNGQIAEGWKREEGQADGKATSKNWKRKEEQVEGGQIAEGW
ncbi:hypothetical protein BGZ60DRAFT_419501 [Tricladium varicosporioides]|nr:hypothetical protein BGZ60DRAFT_419501 [Hymenoscyphus varicosporioides]